ncbi:uncharacterized protein CTHT_0017060 [Thermochaetoides thermophila DSM 1495]|uniref:cAMP-independent regulatory protein n=1 Tax=Chaetomium thermophilum (strain DSM 1495 / CBS 144.50 / IMI 039719) TaxID=759272 RepID=G0S2F6_CHATD|nr:hypothetical protein CTHT_0017060 [Thermochaetoides thermophila DSM 1495]EGS22189.1 hypothetical protein CTHT_0017060 [Thermochaetoides thermophila DSM 1495]
MGDSLTYQSGTHGRTMMETYYGIVRTPVDAIKLFEACRQGVLPRVQRRLSEKERQAIRSGSVFVWDEREAGMRRWTDGKSWSASRVSGSFLTYREMEGKRGSGFGSSRRGAGKTPESGRGSDEDRDDGEPDGYRYKADGLMKQSFSITTSQGQHLHLIAYYSRGSTDLPQPSTDPALRHIIPAKGMYPESSLNDTPLPALTRAPMQPPPPYPHHYPPPPYHVNYPHWPPSPISTPPYGHGQHPYPQPPPHHLPYPIHPSYSHPHAQPPHHSSPYDRPPLALPPPHQTPQLPPPPPPPPPPQSKVTLPEPYPQSQHHSSQTTLPPPRPSLLDSPRAQQLQAQAREAVRIEARFEYSTSPSRSTVPTTLPPLPIPRTQTNGTSHHPPPPPPPLITTSPRVRELSQSPPAQPRSGVSDSSRSDRTPTTANTNTNKASLSALLLHDPSTTSTSASATTPSSTELASANPFSAPTTSAPPTSSQGYTYTNTTGTSPRALEPAPTLVPPLPATLQPAVGTVGAVNGVTGAGQTLEDVRAIGALNKNFCG